MKERYEKPTVDVIEIDRKSWLETDEERNEVGCYNGDEGDRVMCG